MNKKLRRTYRLLFVVAVIVGVLSAFCAFGSLLCIAHGNMKAIVTLVVSVVLFCLASEMGDGTDRRLK